MYLETALFEALWYLIFNISKIFQTYPGHPLAWSAVDGLEEHRKKSGQACPTGWCLSGQGRTMACRGANVTRVYRTQHACGTVNIFCSLNLSSATASQK